MAILVVGSVAFDTIQSSFGKAEKILGGSATYFSLAASYFTEVRIVAVVGDDFTREHEDVLRRRGVCLKGLQHAPGKTFHWGGEYGENVNEAKTHFTDLNVFEKFQPQIPAEYLDSEFLFLANIDPVLQAQVRRKLKLVRLVGGDTMNYWINSKRRELLETLKLMDLLLINDTEAKMLAGEPNLLRAANQVMAMGPKALVIKHGEYGATIFFREGAFGIGRPTGVDLPGEAGGIFRPLSRWSSLSNASISMGQEVALTALQLAPPFVLLNARSSPPA